MYPTELQSAELFIDVASSWHHHWQQLSMTRTAILAQFHCQTVIQEISLHRYSRSIACSFSSVLSCPSSTSAPLIVKFSQVESWFLPCSALPLQPLIVDLHLLVLLLFVPSLLYLHSPFSGTVLMAGAWLFCITGLFSIEELSGCE